MGYFEGNARQSYLFRKRQEHLINIGIRAEKEYEKLLKRYVKLFGTAIEAITYEKLICVGNIMGYKTDKIQKDIKRLRGW